ncbi:hypothetical protein [Vibrio cidicii]|uniref:hypothetical protein n=1 Tax=Vibrio cidicii TaxID=1763883 RepID=UPI003704A705
MFRCDEHQNVVCKFVGFIVHVLSVQQLDGQPRPVPLVQFLNQISHDLPKSVDADTVEDLGPRFHYGTNEQREFARVIDVVQHTLVGQNSCAFYHKSSAGHPIY